MADMYLDPNYMELIVLVNNLKKDVADKIVEKNWLSMYVYPEIKNSYLLKLGVSEKELLLAKINLDKLKRKIEIYNEAINNNNQIIEDKIDKMIKKEFKNRDQEYSFARKDIEEAIKYTHKEKKSNQYIDNLNYIYTNLLMRLSPQLNFKNSKLESDLFEILEKAYKECDLSKMLGLMALCDENNIKIEIEVDDFDYLRDLKNKYTELLEETKSEIFNIRSSEMFSNRTFINSEILLRRKKDDLNNQITEISKEYSKLLKEFEKLKRKI